MLSVAVHKDIAEYQPKIIGKLTARTLVSIVGAIGFSVLAGCYMYFVLGLDVGDNMVIIYAVSLPCWLCGFYRPKGMPFERFFPLWLQYAMSNNKLFYKPTMIRMGLVITDTERKVYGKEYRKLLKRKGIEAYSPREGRVVV